MEKNMKKIIYIYGYIRITLLGRLPAWPWGAHLDCAGPESLQAAQTYIA